MNVSDTICMLDQFCMLYVLSMLLYILGSRLILYGICFHHVIQDDKSKSHAQEVLNLEFHRIDIHRFLTF